MALKVRWSRRAEIGLENVLNYLEREWTNREIIKFGKRLDQIVNRIANYPEIYPQTELRSNTRKGLIDKNNYIIYRVKKDENLVEIINLRGTRQEPLNNDPIR